jgi:hypothetical protein
MAIESLVAALLVLTIGYCMVLNGRLKRLKTDESAMREMIGELMAATEKAERAIGGLKVTVQECEHTLTDRLRMAEQITAVLDERIGSGERLAAGAAPGPARRKAAAPPPPDAKAVVAAANAFAERLRMRAFGNAA